MRGLRSPHAARLTFGALALWWLGCRSFEPLLERVFEDCGEMRTSSLAMFSSGADSAANPEPPSEIEPQNSCDWCLHCVAVQPALFLL